jgi:hypothetical protein
MLPDTIFDNDDDFEDTPDEKIEADLRQAWADAMNGNTRPARELLAEIHKSQKADESSADKQNPLI